MEVTRDNYAEVEEKILAAIGDADFVAIDTEFTGLQGSKDRRLTPVDTIQERYEMAKAAAEEYMVMQYGVCCFKWVDGALMASPFNCYVFPKPFRKDFNKKFLCEASSMDFLNGHGFDFGKWGSKGIPFLSQACENKVWEQHKRNKERERSSGNGNGNGEIKVGGADEDWWADTQRMLGAGLPLGDDDDEDAATAVGLSEESKAPANGTADVSPTAAAKGSADNAAAATHPEVETETDAAGRSSMVLPSMNSYRRMLVNRLLGDKEGSRYLVGRVEEDNGRSWQRLRIVRCSSAEDKAAEAKRLEEESATEFKKEVDDAVGFRRVIDCLSKCGKVVVAHNSQLDLLHTYDKFVGPLPDSHQEATAKLHDLFPLLVDSKVVLQAVRDELKFDSTTLGHAMAALKRVATDEPDVAKEAGLEGMSWIASFADGFERYAQEGEGAEAAATGGGGGGEGGCGQDVSFEHEAAYDAYLTGVVFAAAASCRGVSLSAGDTRRLSDSVRDPAHPLAEYAGRVPMFRLGDAAYSLPGPSRERNFELFLAVSGFPVSARQHHFSKIFKQFLKEGENSMHFHWVDDENLYVECPDSDRYNAVLTAVDDGEAFTRLSDSQVSDIGLHNLVIRPGGDVRAEKIQRAEKEARDAAAGGSGGGRGVAGSRKRKESSGSVEVGSGSGCTPKRKKLEKLVTDSCVVM